MQKPVAILAVLLVAGCATDHDLATGPNHFGGGITREQIKPGFFRITARTNATPWSNFSGAKSSWDKVADSVCGAGKWKELAVQEKAYEPRGPMGVIPYVTTERVGYALCQGASISEDEAKSYAAPLDPSWTGV